MQTTTIQDTYRAAFAAFMTESAEDAILSSTRAGWGGSGYSVELFEDGTFRVLWDNQIGNLYETPGIIISVPQLNDEDFETSEDGEIEYVLFEEALEELREIFEGLEEGE